MNIFLIFLFIPLSFAASAPSCGELATILQNYEKDIYRKTIKDCNSTSVVQIVGEENQSSLNDQNFLEGKRCSDSGQIEADLENLKAELAILDGIDKLKAEIAASKKVATRDAAHTFVESLNTAQSFEVLLDTKDKENNSILNKLKDATYDTFSSRVTDFCKDLEKNKIDACHPDVFKPTPVAINEILTLVNGASSLDDNQITKWKAALAIKRKNAKPEDSPYSFHIMQTEMKEAFAALDKKDGILSKEHIKAIKRLDDFEDLPQGLGFVEDVNLIKTKEKLRIESNKFLFLTGDTLKRQEMNVESKLSILLNSYYSEFEAAGVSPENCIDVKNNFEASKTCIQSIQKEKNKITDAEIKNKLDALSATLTYHEKVSNMRKSCEEELKKSQSMSEDCFKSVSADKAKIQDQIFQLHLLKDKIAAENGNMMIYRNFALNKWNEDCSKNNIVISEIEDCDDTFISKNVSMIVTDSMNIAMMFIPKNTEETENATKVQDLCDDENLTKTTVEDKLCAFFDDTNSDIIVTKNDTHPDGPVEAPDGGHNKAAMKDALLGGTANILSTVLSGIMQNKNTPPPGVNPYPYNYAPYNGGKPAIGIADSILFNARAQGAYGFYSPTPGYAPGAAFSPIPMTNYRAANVGTSRYFN